MKTKNIFKLLASLLICQFAGLIGSFFTSPSIQIWYATLTKPTFNPPNWIFAPVWTALFLLMGIALYLIWRAKDNSKNIKNAIITFAVQLILNIFWSILFFGLHNPLLAFIELIILWLAILATIYHFEKLSKAAAYLLVPYFLWVTFAGLLNFYLWRLNL